MGRPPSPAVKAKASQDALLQGDAAALAHTACLRKMFGHLPGSKSPAGMTLREEAFHRVQGFIDRGVPLVEEFSPDLLHAPGAGTRLRQINPNTPFLALAWLEPMAEMLSASFRDYVEAGYFALDETSMVMTMGEPYQVIAHGSNLMEIALSHSCNRAITAMLDMGATLDGLPLRGGNRTHNGRTVCLEPGDAMGLVELLHGQDDEIFPRLHAAALATRMRDVIRTEQGGCLNKEIAAAPVASMLRNTRQRRAEL